MSGLYHLVLLCQFADFGLLLIALVCCGGNDWESGLTGGSSSFTANGNNFQRAGWERIAVGWVTVVTLCPPFLAL